MSGQYYPFPTAPNGQSGYTPRVPRMPSTDSSPPLSAPEPVWNNRPNQDPGNVPRGAPTWSTAITEDPGEYDWTSGQQNPDRPNRPSDPYNVPQTNFGPTRHSPPSVNIQPPSEPAPQFQSRTGQEGYQDFGAFRLRDPSGNLGLPQTTQPGQQRPSNTSQNSFSNGSANPTLDIPKGPYTSYPSASSQSYSPGSSHTSTSSRQPSPLVPRSANGYGYDANPPTLNGYSTQNKALPFTVAGEQPSRYQGPYDYGQQQSNERVQFPTFNRPDRSTTLPSSRGVPRAYDAPQAPGQYQDRYQAAPPQPRAFAPAEPRGMPSQESEAPGMFGFMNPSGGPGPIGGSYDTIASATGASFLASLGSLQGAGHIVYPIKDFVQQVQSRGSQGAERILQLCRRKVLGTRVAHEFIIVKVDVPANQACYLRIDRRPQNDPNFPKLFLLSSAVAANDTILMSSNINALRGPSEKTSTESFIDYERPETRTRHPPTLYDLAVLLGLIVTESPKYDLKKENCWFFSAAIEEVMGRFFDVDAKYTGKIVHPNFGDDVRKKVVQEMVRRGYKEGSPPNTGVSLADAWA